MCYLVVSKPIYDWQGITMGAQIDGERNPAAPFATANEDGEDWDDGVTVRSTTTTPTSSTRPSLGRSSSPRPERDFIESMRRRVGSAEDHNIAGGHQQVQFADPRALVYASSTDKERPCAVTDKRDNALAARTICDSRSPRRTGSKPTKPYSTLNEIERRNLDCSADDVPDHCTEDRAVDGLDLQTNARQACAQDAKRSADNRLDDTVSWSLRFRDIYRVLVD